MANKEILLVVDVVSNEKEIDKEVIFEAIESALAMATMKRHSNEIDVRVKIDRESGDYETFRRWRVIESLEEIEAGLDFSITHILLEDAQRKNPDIEEGGFIEEPLESVGFGRIGAQVAKQVIVQKVREAERRKVVEAYKDRIGELVAGIVRRVERGNIFS